MKVDQPGPMRMVGRAVVGVAMLAVVGGAYLLGRSGGGEEGPEPPGVTISGPTATTAVPIAPPGGPTCRSAAGTVGPSTLDPLRTGLGWTASDFANSQAVTAAQAVEGCLMLVVDLVGGDPARSQGEAFLDLTHVVGARAPADLSRSEIAVTLNAPAALVGQVARPTFVQVFAKDASDRSKYGSAVNVDRDGAIGARLRLGASQDPGGASDPGFDPANIKLVGIKLAVGPGSTHRYAGEVTVAAFSIDPPVSLEPLRAVVPHSGSARIDIFKNPEGAPPDILVQEMVTDDACHRPGRPFGLRLKWNMTGNQNGGWVVTWDQTPSGRFDGSAFSTLVISVRGATGGEAFQIGVKDTSGHEVKVESRARLAVSNTDFSQISVPLSDFSRGGRTVDRSSIENVNIGFNSNHGNGSVCIDEVRFA